MSVYNRGLGLLGQIDTGTYEWLLLQAGTYTFDPDHDFVSALTPASNECDVAGYLRDTLAGAALTVDDASNRTNVEADGPDFGTLTAGQAVDAVVLYKFVTDDTDSILVAYYAFAEKDTGDISPFVVHPAGGLIAFLDEAA